MKRKSKKQNKSLIFLKKSVDIACCLCYYHRAAKSAVYLVIKERYILNGGKTNVHLHA